MSDEREPMPQLPRPKVSLVGADGNALSVLANCRRAARAAGWTYDDWGYFRAEATAGNYDQLLVTVMKYFEVD